jgi:ribosomal-protein-alanine N-acetyltransferase
MLNTTIRRAAAEDLPRILEIAQQATSAAQWRPSEYERMLGESWSLSEDILLVIQDAGANHTIHGFLAAREVSGEWEIENFAICESVRRHGLGLRLLHEFLRLVHDRQAKEVFLEVRESNLAARALYSKCTFVEAGRRKSYYHNPQEDALILRFSFLGSE